MPTCWLGAPKVSVPGEWERALKVTSHSVCHFCRHPLQGCFSSKWREGKDPVLRMRVPLNWGLAFLRDRGSELSSVGSVYIWGPVGDAGCLEKEARESHVGKVNTGSPPPPVPPPILERQGQGLLTAWVALGTGGAVRCQNRCCTSGWC